MMMQCADMVLVLCSNIFALRKIFHMAYTVIRTL